MKTQTQILMNVTGNPNQGPVTFRVLGKSCACCSFSSQNVEAGLETLSKELSGISGNLYLYVTRINADWLNIGLTDDISVIENTEGWQHTDIFVTSESAVRYEILSGAALWLESRLKVNGFMVMTENLPENSDAVLKDVTEDYASDCMTVLMTRHPDMAVRKVVEETEKRQRRSRKQRETVVDTEQQLNLFDTDSEENQEDLSLSIPAAEISVESELENNEEKICSQKRVYKSQKNIPASLLGKIYEIKSKRYNVDAICTISNGEFMLWGGSVVEPTGTSALRNEFFQENVYTVDGKTVVKADIYFPNPSSLSSFCMGRLSSGYKTLRDSESHKTLDALINEINVPETSEETTGESVEERPVSHRKNHFYAIEPGTEFNFKIGRKFTNVVVFDGEMFILKSGSKIKTVDRDSYIKTYGHRDMSDTVPVEDDWAETITDRQFRTPSSLYGWCTGNIGNAAKVLRTLDGKSLSDMLK